MNNWVRRLLMVGALVITLSVGIGIGVALDRLVFTAFAAPDNVSADAMPAFKLMAEAWNTIDANYVDRAAVESTLLSYGAIAGMVDALGDTGHSRFLTPEMLREEQIQNRGQFEGIGAYVDMRDGLVTIVSPIDNSPAQEAGLQPGDVMMAVDGVDVTTGFTLDEVVQRVLGPAGTQVTLTIFRPDTGETWDVTLTRARIKLVNVTWARIPGTNLAHVRMSAFSQGVTDDLQKALGEIADAGLDGIILDLRNNPGGLLSEAVGTTSQFLGPDNNVLIQRDAQGNEVSTPASANGAALDVPLVVLINQGSASASEIVSGALQDAGRAQLVGETTFGTGTVLNQFALSDGSAMLLATQEWLTPKGRVIWHEGIAPDVAVDLEMDTRPLLPTAERDLSAGQLQSSGDAQLLRAIDLLQGP